MIFSSFFYDIIAGATTSAIIKIFAGVDSLKVAMIRADGLFSWDVVMRLGSVVLR